MHYGMDKTAWHAVVAALNGKLVERQQAFQRRTMFRIFVLLFGGAMADTLALLFSIDNFTDNMVIVFVSWLLLPVLGVLGSYTGFYPWVSIDRGGVGQSQSGTDASL